MNLYLNEKKRVLLTQVKPESGLVVLEQMAISTHTRKDIRTFYFSTMKYRN